MTPTEPEPTNRNPNLDKIEPTRGPNGEPKFDPELDPDRGHEHDEPEMGKVRNRDSDIEKGERSAPRAFDPEALEADRSAARTSDRTDARDGVDASDAFDPDAIGGKQQPKAPAWTTPRPAPAARRATRAAPDRADTLRSIHFASRRAFP